MEGQETFLEVTIQLEALNFGTPVFNLVIFLIERIFKN